jgi:hypothetical protein
VEGRFVGRRRQGVVLARAKRDLRGGDVMDERLEERLMHRSTGFGGDGVGRGWEGRDGKSVDE